MSKIRKLITNPRIIILLIFLVFALLYIHPNPYNTGAAIQSIDKESPAAAAGFESPKPSEGLMVREKIISVDTDPVIRKRLDSNASLRSTSMQISSGSRSFVNSPSANLFRRGPNPEGIRTKSVEDYYSATSQLVSNQTIVIVTNKRRYELTTRQNHNGTDLNTADLGINVYDAPKSNLRKGLDLQGGTRVLLKPERKLTREESDLIIDVLKQRLNIYGLSDIVVRQAMDLSGGQFILVEIAGASEKEVKEIIAKQGKFEARIANQTVFTGGGDITYVCRSARCSGINIRGGGCNRADGIWSCGYHFSIALNPKAAQRQADATKDLEVIVENKSSKYLSEKLEIYLDNNLIQSLSIGTSLKGRVVTNIAISGSGNGTTREQAMSRALDKMKELQTALTTGSLPVKLEIAKSDSLSPLMGQQFSKNALKVGFFAIFVVILIVFIRYKKLQIGIPMILSMLSELLIILGFAAFIKWNLDLAAITGIILVIGTGVDDLIVMSDEALDKEGKYVHWEKKRRNAFFIIMAAYFTTVVAMVPLLFAGAGLVRGFALTTVIGISAGVFIVRPAFAATVKILLDE